MPKILVVDDDEMNRDMLSRRLLRKGYEVVLAVNGVEAIERAVAEPSRADPDGPVDAGPRRLRGDAPAEGGGGDGRHPDHRPLGARDGGRPGEGARGRLRRLRHEARRAARLLGKVEAFLPDSG